MKIDGWKKGMWIRERERQRGGGREGVSEDARQGRKILCNSDTNFGFSLPGPSKGVSAHGRNLVYFPRKAGNTMLRQPVKHTAITAHQNNEVRQAFCKRHLTQELGANFGLVRASKIRAGGSSWFVEHRGWLPVVGHDGTPMG